MKKIFLLVFLIIIISGIVMSLQKHDKMIYKPNYSYKYSFSYYDKNNIQKKVFFAPPFIYEGNDEIFDNAWTFDSNNKEDVNILGFSFNVKKGIINGNQIPYSINYLGDNNVNISGSLTGLIEDKNRIFLHPPRDKFFNILEFAPFPDIRLPLNIGKKWNSSINIPDTWVRRDLKWKGELLINNEYTVIGSEDMITKFGKLKCFRICSTNKDKKINSKLIMYFNEIYGIVTYHYFNYDGSQIIFNLESITKSNEE